MSRFKQWATSDNDDFFPVNEVTQQLPPDYYTINKSMQGVFFSRKPLKSNRLIRFPDSASDSVIEQIEKFWELEESFREDNIPYKRGILVYGPPGSGKTCTLRIVVENIINRGGIVIDFNYTSDFKEGYEVLRAVHPQMPLIVLMEDFDSILNKNSESEVLNLLDGMYGVDKIVFVATTNYPEKLGSRIMNRPSRFDKKIFIGMPSNEARELFIRSKLVNENDEIIKQWVEDTDGMSIAHIHELYVATKKFGESYDTAVEVLKNMSSTPSSSSFDPYISESVQVFNKPKKYKNNPFSLVNDRLYKSNKELFWSNVWKGRFLAEKCNYTKECVIG